MSVTNSQRFFTVDSKIKNFMSFLRNNHQRPATSHLLLLVIFTKLQDLTKVQDHEIVWFKSLR
jgi:hypothetical protein